MHTDCDKIRYAAKRHGTTGANFIMIRLAAASDLDAIDAFDIFAGDRRSEIAQGRCFVSEAADSISGYISWTPKGFVGRDYIAALCVAETHRRRGLGKALVAAVETKTGSGRLFISTEAHNAPMLALLAREGWTPAGCVAGVNADGTAECFFYKDQPPNGALRAPL